MNAHTGEHPKPTYGKNEQQAAHRNDWISGRYILRKVEQTSQEGQGIAQIKLSPVHSTTTSVFTPGPPKLPYSSPRIMYGQESPYGEKADSFLMGSLAAAAGFTGLALLCNPEVLGKNDNMIPYEYTARVVGALCIVITMAFAHLIISEPKRTQRQITYQQEYEALCSSQDTLILPYCNVPVGAELSLLSPLNLPLSVCTDAIIDRGKKDRTITLNPALLLEAIVEPLMKQALANDQKGTKIDQLIDTMRDPLQQISDGFNLYMEVSPPVPPLAPSEWRRSLENSNKQLAKGSLALFALQFTNYDLGR